MTWNDWLDRALVDLSVIAASPTTTEKQALMHMHDAYVNLYNAIEALENKMLEGE